MMKKFFTLFVSLLFSLTLLNAETGKIVGGANHGMPSWFKLSFLDIGDDAKEAQKNNKHLMLFLDLDGCPYCAKMLDDSFFPKNRTSDFIKKHFDVVQIRISGSKEMTLDKDTVITEKEFAKKMKVYFTPTMMFLDGDGNTVARVDGYRSPKNFLKVLKYVDGKYYKKMELNTFLEKVKSKNLYKLKPNKLFSNIKNLSTISTPLALIFEDGSCTQCTYLHNVTFKNKDVKKELQKYTIVRLDASSNEPIIGVSGEKTTPNQMVMKMKLDYRPTILLYNEKKLQLNIDALLYSFHLKERLRYVSGKYYKKYNSYGEYSKVRKKELMSEGATIDLSK